MFETATNTPADTLLPFPLRRSLRSLLGWHDRDGDRTGTKRAKGQDGSSKDWSQTLKGSQCKVCSSDDWSQGLTDAQ